jgi:hypothetical protein
MIAFYPRISYNYYTDIGVIIMEMTEREKARFWTRAIQTRTCWIWQGANTKGYGVFGHRGKTIRASRTSYLLVNGEIPDGYYIMHTCDNPSCINPDHLISGTQSDNIKDMVKKKRFRLGKYSKYKGVGFRPDTGKWRAYVTIDKKQINAGCAWNTELEAAQAYDNLARKLLGSKATLNFN